MDFRKLGIEKAFADLLKEDFTEKEKQYLRENIDLIGNEYLIIKRSKQAAKTAFPPEQQAEIDKFIAEKGFKKVEIEPAKDNYKIELIATQKAKNEVEKMLKNVTMNGNKTLAKSATKVMARNK